jgi:Tol biopolymer transport system component/DNA-binding winged helix-turn-helix (wHTH) protein
MQKKEASDIIYTFGDFRFDTAEKCLFENGQKITLTPRKFALLLMLVENSGHLLEKQIILENVWKDTFVEEGNLTRTISTLRQILGDTKNESNYIETIPRVGYRFIADVEKVKLKDKPLAIEKTGKPESVVIHKKQPARVWLALTLVCLLIALTVSGTFVARRWIKKNRAIRVAANLSLPKQLTNTPQDEEVTAWSKDGKIHFIRRHGENLTESFGIDADGKNEARDSKIAGIQSAIFSPDGKKIVFEKYGGEPYKNNYLSDQDGSNEIKLPFFPGNIAWSPDSKSFLFQTNLEGKKGAKFAELYIYGIETKKIRQLTKNEFFDGDPSFSPEGNEIAFVSDRDGNIEIYLMDTDGSDVRRLTRDPAHDSFPAFSPDGTQISFNSDREDENTDIYVMNRDGRNVVRLTDWKSNESSRFGWSPDGTQFVFASDRDGNNNIYVMNIEPFQARLLLAEDNTDIITAKFSPDGKAILYAAQLPDKSFEIKIYDIQMKKSRVLINIESNNPLPNWSPDGNWIVFNQKISGKSEIFKMKTDQSELTNISNNPASDTNAIWSGKNNEIYFLSNRGDDSSKKQIYKMNTDGSGQTPLPVRKGYINDLSLSPDENSMVFSADRENLPGGGLDIYTVRIGETEEFLLITRPNHDSQAVYSKDGKQIALVGTGSGNAEIYLINADGKNFLRLTRSVATDFCPDFSPNSQSLIFIKNSGHQSEIYEFDNFRRFNSN